MKKRGKFIIIVVVVVVVLVGILVYYIHVLNQGIPLKLEEYQKSRMVGRQHIWIEFKQLQTHGLE